MQEIQSFVETNIGATSDPFEVIAVHIIFAPSLSLSR